MCLRNARDVREAFASRRGLRAALGLFASLAALSGCLPALTLAPVRTDASKPGNVTVEFTATTSDGQPVSDLTVDDLGIFEDGARVEPSVSMAALASSSGNHYVLSYCTPARAGAHDVRIFAHAKDRTMGELTYQFNADGFGAGCVPSAGPPALAPHAVEATAPTKEPEKKVAKPKKPRPVAAPAPESAPARPATSPNVAPSLVVAPNVPPPPPHAPEPETDPFAP